MYTIYIYSAYNIYRQYAQYVYYRGEGSVAEELDLHLGRNILQTFHVYCTPSLYTLNTAPHRDEGCVAEELDLHLGPLAPPRLSLMYSILCVCTVYYPDEGCGVQYIVSVYSILPGRR